MNDLLTLLNSTAGEWTATAVACALKAAGVLAAAGLAATALRARAAATRHLVWGLGSTGALAVLPLAVLLPRWGLPVLSSAEPTAAASADVSVKPSDGVVGVPLATESTEPVRALAISPERSAPVRGRTPSAAWHLSPATCVLAVWLGGSIAVFAWGAAGWATVRRLGRCAEPITDSAWLDAGREAARRLGVAGRLTLLRGAPGTMPLTWGTFRPVLLLPGESDAWPLERKRAVLMHELAHVRRRDCLTQWLSLATCATYWFNPLAWWAASRLRSLRELACDDLVLEMGARPSDYAAELLGVARSLRAPRGLCPAAMAMARTSGLERRLRAILDVNCSRGRPARWLIAACFAGVVGASATLAAVRLVARDTEKPVVSGRVLGPDGKPVEGASVVVLASPTRRRNPVDDLPPAATLGQARTDAQGQFRAAVANNDVPADWRVLLVTRARGAGMTVRALDDPGGRLAEPIRLAAEQPLEVKLVDLQGAPLAGARVRLRGAYFQSSGQGLSQEFVTADSAPELAPGWTTDSAGRFRLDGLSSGLSLALDVRAARFGRQWLNLETRAGAATETLSLGLAHVIEGRVTLGQGGPPAVGARVRTRSMSSKHGYGHSLGVAEATTDADGRYRIEAAPGGGIRVEVFPPRDGADGYLLRGSLVVPGDAVASRADFVLPRGVVVKGRVIEAGTGRPVAGAVVFHQAHERNNPYFIKGGPNWFNGDEQTAITAADGSYTLAAMPGPGYVLVRAPTTEYLHDEISSVDLRGMWIWPNERNYPDALKKLNPKPTDGPIELDLTVRRGATVRGHVVDSGGQPAGEVVLFSRWYVPIAQMSINNGQGVLPVRGGTFELRSCDPESTAPVFFLDPKKQLGAVIELSGKQAGQDVVVKLQPCGSATVQLVDGQGKPLRAGRRAAHIDVVLTPGASPADLTQRAARKNQSPLMADAIYVPNLDHERYRTMTTDEQGRMTFPTLIPGAKYRVGVFNQPDRTEIEFTVKPGETRDLGKLVIHKVEAAG